ncbi:ACP S-malonyltransferase [Proteus mirabilis]|uniref:ACP S-malonyltransferase n=2 Tax=Proteus mirabilis TaxID=584 RepID=UPI0007A5FF56|nr:ACP S-malonyltransferase [Proteus mirabilis]AZH07258.1 ACP S-malonyltransferase [Proteus mirabilis]ELA8071611.1 ACP S-malonyltransferase [Proteus mirabilis]ELJ9402355.1 ACP S-malonyltransferase [Proteus mirabilis]ELJ9435435.1 ACP S-malonyltransferase [Proteus mirabilis]ELS1786621.1 ACP S-malonyltransferase [Proteus mirabilis]
MPLREKKYHQNQESILFFPGQGRPYLGMGNRVYRDVPSIKEVWNCASEIAGFDVRTVCLKGPMNKLVQTCYQQVALTTINIASLYLLREHCYVNEAGYSGHSAGEYSALFAANVLELESVFKLISYRASIMQQLAKNNKGVMYVVKNCPYQTLSTLIAQQDLATKVNICCDNSELHQVIGGEYASVRKVVNQLANMKIETNKLAVNGAWHTELMSEGKNLLAHFLQTIPFSIPDKPLVMNVSAEIVSDIETIKQNLVNQLTETVRWTATMALWCHLGYHNFIELGDSKSLYYLAKNSHTLKDKNILHVNDYI